jgi:MoaA/NifB/PqqE/SkfB family radical SAM enzyme
MKSSSVLQVHPLRRCNLSCAHCYSTSSPDVAEELPVEVLVAAITAAAAEGYGVLAVSGGEPLLYKQLPRLLEQAHAVGMTTAVTTNGTLVNDRRLAMLADADLVAVSIDGVAASHDRMRGSGSFERTTRGVQRLRDAGIRFGFIFTLTMRNLHELDWVAGFAVAQGAALLQVHPLELAGRGRTMGTQRPDETELQWAVVECARLRARLGDALTIHVDAVPAGALRRAQADACGAQRTFAQLVDPLVVESDGTISPIEHGFDRRWSLGSLHEQSLGECIERFRSERLAAFEATVLRGAVLDSVTGGSRFVNWHEAVARRAAAGLRLTA